MDERQPVPTPRGEALRRLRQELGWSEERFGEPHGLSGKVVSNLEKGWRKEPTLEEAEKLIEPMGLPPVALDVSHEFGRWVRAAAPPPQPVSPEEEDVRRCIVAAGLFGLHLARRVFPALLRDVRQKRFEGDRQQAAERLESLRRLPTQEARRERIRSSEDDQTWALVEALTHESVRAAADKPAKAIQWAELALFTVPFVPGPDGRRQRLEGWVTFHLGNALRVANDLDASDAAFLKAWTLWNEGEDDFLPLDEGRPFDLEASLRREQRRFQETLDLLTKAREISPEESAGRILLKRAATLEQMGEAEASIEALREARPHVEKAGEPRDLWVLLCSTTLALWHVNRFKEADDLLADAWKVAIQLGNELDLARMLWLAARVDASLGRTAKAAAAFTQVFEDMIAHVLPYDAALAGLDLAVLHLEQGHTREVLSLALRIEAVFTSLRIEREAMSALLVFCEAARREEATVELARRTAEVIEKVQREQHSAKRGGD